jgi:hypothetical protein
MIYTYLPFFLRTLLHPSHIFLTELRTFMPRVCVCDCTLNAANRVDRSKLEVGVSRSAVRRGEEVLCIERAHAVVRRSGAEVKRVRRSGRMRVWASMVAVLMVYVVWVREFLRLGDDGIVRWVWRPVMRPVVCEVMR